MRDLRREERYEGKRRKQILRNVCLTSFYFGMLWPYFGLQRCINSLSFFYPLRNCEDSLMGTAKRGSHLCFDLYSAAVHSCFFPLVDLLQKECMLALLLSAKRTSKIHNYTITSGQGLASHRSGNGFQTKAGLPLHVTFVFIFAFTILRSSSVGSHVNKAQ